ncbi:MAG: hypothetical protein GY937_22925 [bacterium]|nr:hypothetical protein [bacterium]
MKGITVADVWSPEWRALARDLPVPRREVMNAARDALSAGYRPPQARELVRAAAALYAQGACNAFPDAVARVLSSVRPHTPLDVLNVTGSIRDALRALTQDRTPRA